MGTNEFEKGNKFSFNKSIDYANKAVVSKHILKNKMGNISLFAFDKGEGLSEHTAPFDAVAFLPRASVRILPYHATHQAFAPRFRSAADFLLAHPIAVQPEYACCGETAQPWQDHWRPPRYRRPGADQPERLFAVLFFHSPV